MLQYSSNLDILELQIHEIVFIFGFELDGVL